MTASPSSLPTDPSHLLRAAIDEMSGHTSSNAEPVSATTSDKDASRSEGPAAIEVPAASDARGDDAKASDAKASDGKASDGKASDGKASDGKAAESSGDIPAPAAGSSARRVTGAGALSSTALSTMRRASGSLARHPRSSVAAGLVVAAMLGYAAGHLGDRRQADVAAQRWTDAALVLHENHEDVTHLVSEMRGMRSQIEGLRNERQRADVPAKLVQTSERLERSGAENSVRVGKLSEQIERLEKTQRDPARIAAIVERLDRIERQTQTVAERVATPVPPPKPAVISANPALDVAQTGSVVPAPKSDPKPDAKDAKVEGKVDGKVEGKPADPRLAALDKAAEPDLRRTPLDGYVLRDVGDNVALIESRKGRLIEVHPGQALGAGNRIEAIERRGRQWVVVTSKGFIGAP